MHRQLRTQIPVSSTYLQCKDVTKTFMDLLNNSQIRRKFWNDTSITAKNKVDFGVMHDENVLEDTGKWKPGKIVNVCTKPRSYIVQCSQGSLLKRKKIFLGRDNTRFERKSSETTGIVEREQIGYHVDLDNSIFIIKIIFFYSS